MAELVSTQLDLTQIALRFWRKIFKKDKEEIL
jgi:hypothetical protein